MSVELEPQELGFRRPFTQEVTQVLKLTNLNHDRVAFKVKTTAPKQYCVRPNSGYIKPGEHVEVQVLLQAMKEDPPLDVRCRDKFLVQSVAIDDDHVVDDANIWANIDKVAKDSIKEKKIRVNFLPERDGAATANGTSHEAPPAYAPPSPPSVATSPTGAAVVSESARDFSTPSKRASGMESAHAESANANSAHSTSDAKSAPLTEKASEMYNSAVASVSNAAGATSETLQQQLDNAEETIAQLKEQIQAQAEKLRQRVSASTSGSDAKAQSLTSGAPLATQQHTVEGVPVQMVAGLCLMSFLIAYFFF